MTATKPKVVAIIGATGTGKSQLAVDLALRHNGEIINCDAVQMYKGLPIITNQITLEEQKGVPHHLLGKIELDQPTWTVAKFVPEALRVIEDLRQRGKLPILVGGTHYYVQSLLVEDTTIRDQPAEVDEAEFQLELQQPTEVLLQRLREVDPIMADRWHPNERRKIQRSLQIWLQTGKRASDIYEEQQTPNKDGKKDSVDKLRFDPLVFWIHASSEKLKPRLDARVLRMIDNGLYDELSVLDSFKTTVEASGEEVDMTKGIWVSIGFKEFSAYLKAIQQSDDAVDIEKAKVEGIDKAQIATRQYAKRQIRWIQYKFLNAMFRNSMAKQMFLLDGSDVNQCTESVRQPALDIVQSYLAGQELPDPIALNDAAKELLRLKGSDVSHDRQQWVKRTCETCGVVAVTLKEWEKHVQSNRHKKLLSKARKPRYHADSRSYEDDAQQGARSA